ncbi:MULTISPECIES: type IA DNA topoisomerase [unclassified Apibacter]|uniref:type IA DNA topoisomerase n=1 Tax=unclassified Apibacter TaxID=2630820 RepID=UPI00135D96EF|nr:MULTISPECIES: type IA DNA topoisomerase [unclassified Apibacter]MXP06486.1 DNA topoisomerase III [Apibacter sp. B3546]MXP12711.1 DNA topoisomerase III [Apibacter sp. B3239]
MIVCIAEKPSVAKDIAQIVGAKERKDGFYQGNGYQVTWTFGHLCTLKEPHDYNPNWKYWYLEDLPIIPSNFGIKLISNKGVEKQFKVIESLVAECEEVINCGDAGQEGELIQRWVLLKAKCKVPIKRLWISSLTEQSIKEGFENLKDSSQYENLYAAGSARAIGDWLLGINATRLFTKKFAINKTLLSIGRVQTPTLAMIVQRQKEIDSFVIEEYWELKTMYKNVEFIADIDRLKSEDRAKKGLEYLQKYPFEIVSFEKKEGKEKNPRLFDLTSLQVEANKKYGYSADHTLKYIQSLYEKKFVTYPRVDTTYLSEDLYPKIYGILSSMKYYEHLIAPLLENPIPKSKAVFDDTKVTDHHAIIPTDILPEGISTDEKKIYDLVARRFIAVFYPECKISNTLVTSKVGEVPFKASGKQILEPGWRIIYEKDKKNEKEENLIPVFEVGESGPHDPFIHQGKTTPPKYFTEATLLRSMETAGKQVDDEEMREVMKDNGIGRPSTRANIIETLLHRKYIEKKRKNIYATSTGMDLIDTIQSEILKSVELTGLWEKKLRLIEKGEYSSDLFKKELIEMVTDLTQEVKNSQYRRISIQEKKNTEINEKSKKQTTPLRPVEDLFCPKCKTHKLIKGKSAYGCSDFKNCSFTIPFEIFGKKLTLKQISDLIGKGKTTKIKGFTVPESQEKRDGILLFDENFGIVFET